MSLIPARILRVLEFVGFSGNREVGMKELERGATSDTFRAPICTAFLLFYHTMLTVTLGESACHTMLTVTLGESVCALAALQCPINLIPSSSPVRYLQILKSISTLQAIYIETIIVSKVKIDLR